MESVVIRRRLLGLPGSLRSASYSRAVLSGIAARLRPHAELRIHGLHLPLYNEDEEGASAPASVNALREAIHSTDGLVIATPEYNHGMPGLLKNALDWASRPYGQSVLIDKPVLVISASPAFTGGVRAHAQVNETLLACGARPLGAPQVVIGTVGEKIRGGQLTDEPSLAFALSAMNRLLAMGNGARQF
jgi:chromate reductase, NAD(P)H dehydrogenase (quinone)